MGDGDDVGTGLVRLVKNVVARPVQLGAVVEALAGGGVGGIARGRATGGVRVVAAVRARAVHEVEPDVEGQLEGVTGAGINGLIERQGVSRSVRRAQGRHRRRIRAGGSYRGRGGIDRHVVLELGSVAQAVAARRAAGVAHHDVVNDGVAAVGL